MIIVQGIKNCDTVKKAVNWLQQHHLDYQFRDVRDQSLSEQEVLDWLSQLTPEQLINKRSTSWRQLTDTQKQLTDKQQLAQLIVANPTLFKRPLVIDEQGLHVGFKAPEWQQRYL